MNLRARTLHLALSVTGVLCLAGCSGGNSATPPTPSQTTIPQARHVFVVVLENQSYGDVIGNPIMPFLNSQVTQYALAMQYYANTHPSIGNYFMLTTGQVVTNDDDFAGPVDADSAVRQLTRAGKTWKAYLQSLPSAGYTGGDVYPYVKHHNPFAYLTDVLNSEAQKANLVPLPQLAADLRDNRLPEYAFVVPDNTHNAHDCPAGLLSCSNDQKLGAADDWLRDNIGPLLTSTTFQESGLLLITFDEAAPSDSTGGGGRVALLLLGPRVKSGFQSNSFYQHQSTLRLTLEVLGVSSWPGAAAISPGMAEFFR